MSEKKVQEVSYGTRLSTVLLIIFIVLKLTKNIDWSWWWVLSPLWIPIAIILFFFGIAFLAALIGSIFDR